ncbi:MAG: UDP-2,3-diacylglucosamine diphosphatase LpxI [Candidatus Omnitrophota bacterium]|jgi:DUF1009 family protein
MDKIGLIAGNRKFPLLLAASAKKQGCYIVTAAIKKDTDPEIKKFSDKIYWLGLNEFSRLFEVFKGEGVTNVIMAGQISPRRLFSREIGKDPVLKNLLFEIKNKKADTIFGAIAEKLKSEGIKLLDSTIFVKEYLFKKGILTKLEPSPEMKEDISFGFELAKAAGGLDIGQTVAVKNKAIVAVEAFEGTDNLIRRAGRLAGRGITVVKVSKPGQDMRFDIPVIGYNTVKNLARAHAACLAIEAEKVLFIDKEKSLQLANKFNISIVAV